eukprot:gene11717-2132_t
MSCKPGQGCQATCLHVHGFLPSLYVPYDAGLPTDEDFVRPHLLGLVGDLESCLAQQAGPRKTRRRFVHDVGLVRACPFYGFSPKMKIFIKIDMYSPLQLRRAANSLGAGMIRGRSFQPYQAHLPYELQFMVTTRCRNAATTAADCLFLRRPVPLTFQHPCARLPHACMDWGALAGGGGALHVDSAWTLTGPAAGEMFQASPACSLEFDVRVSALGNRQHLPAVYTHPTEGPSEADRMSMTQTPALLLSPERDVEDGDIPVDAMQESIYKFDS